MTLKPTAKCKVISHPVYSNFGEGISKEDAKKKLNLQDDKLILFFGFIRDYKGLDILLEAMADVKNKLDIKLIVAGEFYSNKKKYLDLITELDLKNNVHLFTDFIPTSYVKYYFSASDLVILPYKDATQSGIVQIAMNFRKPIVATNVGGLGEVVHNNKTGFIVETKNPSQLADAILKFYNENKEEEFIRNTEKELEKYSWEKFVEGIFELTNS